MSAPAQHAWALNHCPHHHRQLQKAPSTGSTATSPNSNPKGGLREWGRMKLACSHSNTLFSVLVTPHKAEAQSLVPMRDLFSYVKHRVENNPIQTVCRIPNADMAEHKLPSLNLHTWMKQNPSKSPVLPLFIIFCISSAVGKAKKMKCC